MGRSPLKKQFDQNKKKKDSLHRSVFARLRRYFLGGVLVAAPISITLYITLTLLNFIDTKVAAIIAPEYYAHSAVPGLGLLVAVVFFILVGWGTRNYLGRLFIDISEYAVDRMPLIRTLYSGTKQVFETVMGAKSQAFRDVVMFEYPRPGLWTMGFVASPALREVREKLGEDAVNVFLPTTPSPTNGILLFIPVKDLHFMNLSVEEAFKMILSGGILTPPDPAQAEKKSVIGKDETDV